MIEGSKPSTYVIPCHDIAHVVEFSPFEWSSQLLAIGTSTRITVVSCRFQEEDQEVDGHEVTQVRDFQHGCRVTAIAWSPETSLAVIPKALRFAAAGSDNRLRIFSSDLKSADTIQILEGHTSYINDLTFDPDQGEQLASTSDDLSCRIWSRDGSQVTCFQLGSPGMSIGWHRDDPMKIMVAQKDGIIKFFSLHNQHPIMSLDCGHTPLMAADWCPSDCLIIGAAAGSDWFRFDTSRSSRPLEKHSAHSEGARRFRWSKTSPDILATTGRPGSQVKVYNLRHNQMPINSCLAVAYGLSWHYRLPIIAVGGDKKIHLWTVDVL